MAEGYFFAKPVTEKTLLPCYVFFGEETYLAREFVLQLKSLLIPSDAPEHNLERIYLEESSWMDILDLARTAPFFFSPWRIIIVEIQEGEVHSLSSVEERILGDYLASPPSKTVLVCLFSGTFRKNNPLLKFFSSFPSSCLSIKELKPLQGKSLHAWMEKKLESLGKTATPEALRRIEEIVGNDLRRLGNELEKLAAFAAEKRVIDADDVNLVSDWVKTFAEWEFRNTLEERNYEKSLVVLNNLFKEGVKTEYILGMLVNFLRDILYARACLREKSRDRKDIFRMIYPKISETWSLYQRKFRAFFAVVDEIPEKDMRRFLERACWIDTKIKTTDVSPQALFEGFLFEYCSLQKKDGLIRKEGRR